MTTETATAPAAQPIAAIERMPRQRETIVVESAIPVLDTAMFEHMQRIATMMASSSLVPVHLNSVRKVAGQDVAIEAKEAVANCFLVTNQAVRWRMDPFAVAQHTYVTKGRIGYEGKLVAAVINSRPEIERRLTYTYSGQERSKDRKVTVTAKLRSVAELLSIQGTVKQWETTGSGSPWGDPDDYDQMLSYRGAREWARRWFPEAILGVWGDDEIAQFDATARTLAGAEHPPAQQQRGAAGLKQALNVGATDAVVVGETTKGEDKQAEPAASNTAPKDGELSQPGPDATAARQDGPVATTTEKKAKVKGTLALLEKYTGQFQRCTDAETLAIARDEARMYEWAEADQEALDVAYSQRQDEILKAKK